MKKVFSILFLLILIFFVFQWGINLFKNGHEVTYQIVFENSTFDVLEKFQDNYYDIVLKQDNQEFYYTFNNNFNKQKKIVEKVEVYIENDDVCVYPILINHEGTSIQCIKGGTNYTDSSFPNQDFIGRIKNDLIEKKYTFQQSDTDTVEVLENTSIYKNNLLANDIVTLWDYKGIQVIKPDNFSVRSVLGFDKYENTHGYLVDQFYIIPIYFSSKILEFSEVVVVNIENLQYDRFQLGYTLSSDTYINGVIDHKLYYTDPSNLLQIEINPSKKSTRLIGNTEIGGQLYNGNWQDVNIYDFKSSTILFQELIPEDITNKYPSTNIVEGKMNYYLYNQSGEVYQIPKEHHDKAILLLKANNLNNFKVVGDTLYYVVDNTAYYYQTTTGIVPILKNNELRYNIKNRIDIERKS